MFSFQMIEGSAASLNEPSTALMARSTAEALFGKTDPIGKVFKLNNGLQLKLGGVFEDLAANLTFHNIKVLLQSNNAAAAWLRNNTDWDNHNSQLYAELADGVTAEQATARIKNLPTPNIKEDHEELMAYPVSRKHLYGEFKNGQPSGGLIVFVWLFGTIGGFVLLLACINFMNLSTARSERRAREVGIRKTVGSSRGQLIRQFLGESVMMAFLALILTGLLVQLALPWFNEVEGKEIPAPWANPLFWVSAIGFSLFTGFLAGSYPAFYLSGFDAVKVLKGTFRAGKGTRLPRQILVVTQFTVSLALIIGTIIVFRQIQCAKDRPAGYDRAGLVTIPINTGDLSGHYDELRNEILSTGVADNMAESSYSLTGFWQNNNLDWPGETPAQKAVNFRDVYVTPDFGKTIGWTIVRGWDFSHAFKTDSDACVLNEAGLQVTGFKDPIGRVLNYFGKPYTIIGIANNLLSNDPYDTIEPAIFLGRGWLGTITIRIKPGTPMRTAIAALQPVFKRRNPGSPFMYKFIDDDYAQKFAAETRIGQLAAVFAGLAIFISCLGLFGLASYLAEQRNREIGVRKVLGAGVFNLWGLLSRDFVRLVALSMLIAMPLAYWGMAEWLRNYAYHTSLSWWIFAAAGAGILIITLLTVSFQSIKAAMMNPVQSLRSE
jgi:ABC-type antimicrobial peptide transport system permease subunit